MNSILRNIFYSCICIALFASCSCDNKNIEQGEQDQASVEAAIMEGRTAARRFIGAESADTLALQTLLLDARAKHSSYTTRGRHREAEAFDTAFIHTLRAVKPDVAVAVQEIKSKQK